MEQLRVQWTEFPTSLTGALGQLQHAGELADVTLACEGRRIHAHKLVLSACSPYFRDAFKENPCHHPIIILKDVQAQDILYLLSYMYRGEVNVEENELSSFIQTAELLQIKGLTTGIVTQAKKPIQISNQPKKSGSNSASSKKIPPLVNPACISSGKMAVIPQKRRRNSAGEKLIDPNSDPSKKVKATKDKLNNNNKKSETIPTENSKQTESSPKLDGENAEMTSICEPVSPVEIKHEIDEYPELEVQTEENDPSDDDTPSGSPTPFYETSMLARSLISGAQSLKNDNTASVQSNKSKLVTQPASNLPGTQNSNSKSNAPIDETLVKTEKLSPRSDVMELEPEVLISEQDESLPATVRPLIGPKNNNQTAARADQVGASTSQATFNQTNHAAICGDCPHCGTKYSNQSALKYHVRLMHSDLTNRLCCYLCPRSFTIRDTFKEHMWTSHGQRN